MSVQIGQKIMEGLAEEMVKEGVISSDQLSVARVSREDLGLDLGQILIKRGFITENQLLVFLGRFLSIPFVSLRRYPVQPGLIQSVPLHLARRYHLIPLRKEGNEVIVAMANPMDTFALDEVRASLHSEVKPVLSSSDEIDALIAQHYGVGKSNLLSKKKETELIELMAYTPKENLDITGDHLEKIATGPQVVMTVNQIIAHAFQEKASDIHIEPSRGVVRVRYRVDGLLEERERLSKELHLPIVSRIKIMAGLDIAERRIPQDGRVRLQIGGGNLDLRVSTYPTLHGEKVVLRLLSKEGAIGIESMGFSEKDRKTFAELISKSHGIFLVTGPTGSGKSTTLYAALTRINSPDKNIISIEDPVESEIKGVNQAQINLKTGVTFVSALRSILRQDPDVIMIGEIRDAETAEIAVRAAITGHLVLSTLHTNTAAGAISRLNDLGTEPFLLSSAIIGVLAQRLVRKICPDCRKEVPPDLANLGPLAAYFKRCFRGTGCPACRMSGYSGRIGIFELAPMGDTVRKMIGNRAADHEIEAEMRRLGVRSIIEDGLEKVNEGITTIEEVLRVTQEN